jgi:bacterioferritin (cytochrome b1)
MIRLWLARMTAWLRWSSPRRTGRLLLEFARAERSSHYDMLSAANHCTDLQRRALYLSHARDEALHAQMFALRAVELYPAQTVTVRADFEDLFERLGELRFLAFVHRAELRGLRQLGLYREELKARGDHKTRALFDAILRDEQQHASYTREQLLQLAGSEHALRKSLSAARAWELWRSWRRLGSTLAVLIFDALMRVLFLCLAPLAWLQRLGKRR